MLRRRNSRYSIANVSVMIRDCSHAKKKITLSENVMPNVKYELKTPGKARVQNQASSLLKKCFTCQKRRKERVDIREDRHHDVNIHTDTHHLLVKGRQLSRVYANDWAPLPSHGRHAQGEPTPWGNNVQLLPFLST